MIPRENAMNDLTPAPRAFLLTGCAGFIGANTTRMLLESGAQVVGWDNLNDAYAAALKQWRLERLQEFPNFRFMKVDISRREEILAAWNALSSPRFEAIIHLAARAGVRYSVENPWTYIETNCIGTLNLLELCRVRSIPKCVLASSSSVYGETSVPILSEDLPTQTPCSPYAASKIAGEGLAYAYHHLHGLDVSILRFFTVYGPAGRPDMSVLRFVHAIAEEKPLRLYGDGRQVRDFTYIDDIARGVFCSLKKVGLGTFNLGGGAPSSVRDMIRIIADHLGKAPQVEYHPSHPADMESTQADISRARSVLGWVPNVAFEEGLKRTIAWYLENRSWVRSLATLSGE
ncbi:MAG: SDR family NAD(P)-dependent oxidoreductase [Planctomycetia bacterium]|nr:SDR family NAD(P)-dependent oxidoreductase [Planctomycetia bacterium]